MLKTLTTIIKKTGITFDEGLTIYMCTIRQQKENINKMDYSCKRNNMKMSHK